MDLPTKCAKNINFVLCKTIHLHISELYKDNNTFKRLECRENTAETVPKRAVLR